MNEAETRAEYIDPALKVAGWGVVEGSRVEREYGITLGRLQGAGKRSRPDIADYVLSYKGHRLAVIEAKKVDLSETEGAAQAKRYAERPGVDLLQKPDSGNDTNKPAADQPQAAPPRDGLAPCRDRRTLNWKAANNHQRYSLDRRHDV